MTHTHSTDETLRPALGLWDAVSLIVGIVVGVSIFKVSGTVCAGAGGPWTALGLWLAGGVLSLVGALCYAELASTWPRTGGDYVYLTRAFGRPAGFLFGWAHLTGILTGSIGVLAFVFADFAVRLWRIDPRSGPWLAVAAVAALTFVNLLGVVLGKTVQNLLTAAKVIGLVGIVAAGGLAVASAAESTHAVPAAVGKLNGDASGGGSLQLALIMVLYAFGGWSDAAFVAAEVREPRRNVPRALVLGVALITLTYLAVNAAYLAALGFAGLSESQEPAADTLQTAFGPAGEAAICLIVMLSALGGINGLIFTGARVHASLGRDYRAFALLGRWHPRFGTPAWSLAAQSAVTLLLIVAVGTPAGRGAIDAAFEAAGQPPLDWEKYGGGFDTLVAATAPVFWTFFLLTGLSLFALRLREPLRERPFRVPLYPVLPAVFCLMCLFMLVSSLEWAGRLAVVALAPLAAGVPLYVVGRRWQ